MKSITPTINDKLSIVIFSLTIFLSAFLLFQVQPLIGKYILPWFGGAASVWTICMLFFQLMLLAGYLYAHGLMKLANPKLQTLIHVAIIIAAYSILPIMPDASFADKAAENPVVSILSLLLLTIGLPYFILSSTSTLIQSWFGRAHPGKSPYPLFALSNAASLIALLSYPFLIEPLQALPEQTRWWGYGFGIFCLLITSSAIIHILAHKKHSPEVKEQKMTASIGTETPKPYIYWFTLAACASITLLAITNYLTQDVASVPFLWVIPLCLYLLSFILCFESNRWYRPKPYFGAFFILLGLICFDLFPGPALHLIAQIMLYLAFLFIVCMICHGELARAKPDISHLTKFYLIVSAGGAMGGIFVGLIAPLVFVQILEMHVSILLIMLLSIWIWSRYVALSDYPWSMRAYSVALGTMVAFIYFTASIGSMSSLELTRNFYGPVAALERDDAQGRLIRVLRHGRINHGFQYQQDDLKGIKTAYYGPTSGIGRILEVTDSTKNRSIAIIGLGVGTLAAYANPGDKFNFFEINPEVTRLAKSYFTFLADSAAEITIRHGDGRLSLEDNGPQKFDIVALDAFSSDSIPTHLLTSEAFELYISRLKPGGAIAIHISNLHIDFRPVVYAAADKFAFDAVFFESPGNAEDTSNLALWMILSKDHAKTSALLEFEHSHRRGDDQSTLEWTDNFTNIFSLLK